MKFNFDTKSFPEEKAVETVKPAEKKATKAAAKKTVEKTSAKKTVVKKATATKKATVKKTVIKKPVKSAKVKPIKAEKKSLVKKPAKAKTLKLKAPEALDIQSVKPQEPQEYKFTVEPSDLPADIQTKFLRRAKRYFKGDNIRHRVVSKTENSISFRLNRFSSKYPEVSHGATITVTRTVV